MSVVPDSHDPNSQGSLTPPVAAAQLRRQLLMSSRSWQIFPVYNRLRMHS